MRDEMKMCGRCHHEHAIGILRYSQDSVPLYGARPCTHERKGPRGFNEQSFMICGCRDFVEAVTGVNGELMLPAAARMSADELGKLWKATSFLSPQTPAETRIAVRQLDEITDPREREKAYMALMISHVTDIRAAMTKDESKFNHLVAHTDEIVDAMRGTVQLSERLTGLNQRIDDTNDRLDGIERMLKHVVGLLTTDHPIEQVDAQENLLKEARRVFHMNEGGKLQDEAVVTDGSPVVDPDLE